MTIFLLPVLALCAIYVGTVEAAFSALMRLSLRLTVERTGRAVGLGVYLDDPVLLFVPARLVMVVPVGLVMGGIIPLAAILFAAWTGMDDFKDPWVLGLSMLGFVLAFEHLIPLFIVRYDPERVLIALLPSFTMLTIFLRPLSRSLVGIIATLRRERQTQPSAETGTTSEDESAGDAAHAYLEAGEQEGLIEREERRLIESIVDFGDTVLRGGMEPRPDIVAVRADATLADLRQVFGEQQYSRVPVYRDSLHRLLGFLLVKDLVALSI